MEPMTYTLTCPIERRDDKGVLIERITSVTLKRPKGRDLKSMDQAKGKMGQTMNLIAASCSLLPIELDEMDGKDILALGEMVTGFLGISLPTGET